MLSARERAVVLSVVLLSAGAAGTGFGTTLSSGESNVSQESRVAQANSCDFTSLYNETIDSVVALQTDSGQGSGFVYQVSESNNSTYVVTNAHVVGDAGSVVVQFSRDESERGTVVGRDVFTDLAVVRVDGAPSYVEALSVDQSVPVPGRHVAALGTPFGLEETITHGIVSGVNRSMPTDRGFEIPNVIQTDTPINPGNSGGPLVTCDGDVVGVNSAGIVASRADNVGFAIPSSLVSQVVPSLVENGTYEHAYLGIESRFLTPALIDANDLNVTDGIYVHRVAENSPASGALQGSTGDRVVNDTLVPVGGDVIVAINNRTITSGTMLSAYLLTEKRPGDTATLTIVRDGQRQEVNVTLGTRPQPATP